VKGRGSTTGSNDGASVLERRIAVIEARAEIESVLRTNAHSADRRDLETFKSTFHPDSTHHHVGHYKGTSLEFADVGFGVLFVCEFTAHYLTNIEVAVALEHGVASSECSFVAAHLLRADAEEGAFGGHRHGIDEIKWVAGRYFDRFELRDGSWRIADRKAVHDWEHWHEVDSRGFERDVGEVPAFGPYTPDWIRGAA
jgi:hypothetical protein